MFFSSPADFRERELSPRVTTRLVWEKTDASHVNRSGERADRPFAQPSQ